MEEWISGEHDWEKLGKATLRRNFQILFNLNPLRRARVGIPPRQLIGLGGNRRPGKECQTQKPIHSGFTSLLARVEWLMSYELFGRNYILV